MTYFALGWIQAQEKQFAAATQSIRKFTSVNDRVPAANCLLAGLLAVQNQPDAAIAIYQKLLIEDETVPSAYCTTMGVALLQPNLFEGTIQDLRRMQVNRIKSEGELRNVKALAHNGIGEVLQHQGKLKQAIAQYEKAIAIDPEFEVAKDNLKQARSLMR